MADKGFTVILSARTDQYVKAINQAKDSTDRLLKVNDKWGEFGAGLESIGRSVTTKVTLPLTALGVGAVASAVQWESAWAGVTKTVDGTAQQMAGLESGLRDMAKELPATHGEIAAVAEAAGQLGVHVDDIESFSRTMLDLGETTNLSANEAATQLARFMNIMGSASDDVDNIGAAVVGLGNNFATTEAEIVAMGMRLAGAGAQMGLTEGEVLGLATALSSVGVEAEAGGTAMTLTMKRIATEVETGGSKLGMFAEVAGMSAEEFARAWRTDAAGALVEFIGGLSDTESMGMSTIGVLTELGITGVRESDALLRLSGATEVLTDAMGTGNDEFAKGTALTEEAEKRYATFASQLSMFRNQLVDVGIALGDSVLPALGFLLDVVGGAVALFDSLPGPLKTTIVAFGALVAAVGPALWITGSLITSYQTLTKTLAAHRAAQVATATSTTATTAATGGLAGAMGALRAAMVAHPILTIATVIGGVAAAFAIFGNSNDEAKRKVDELADSIRDAETLFKGLASAVSDAVHDNDLLRDVMVSAGLTTGEMTRAIDAGGDALTSFADELKAGAEAAGLNKWEVAALVTQLGHLAEANAKAAEDQAELNRVEAEGGFVREDLRRQQMDYVSGLRRRAEASEAAKRATEDDTVAVGRASDAERDYVRWLSQRGEAAQAGLRALEEDAAALEEWQSAINSAFNSGRSSVSQFSDEAMQDIDLWQQELTDSILELAQWQNNLAAIGAATAPEFAAWLAEMGMAGAGLVETMAATPDELQQTYDLWVSMTEQTGRDMATEMQTGGSAATKALQTELGNANKLLLSTMGTAGEDIGHELVAGIGSGISNNVGLATGAGVRAAHEVVQAVRGAMQIQSPSRVMAELVGLPMVQGIAQGIIDGSPEAAIDAAEAAGEISEEIADRMRDDLRAEQEAQRMAERVAGAMVSEFERQRDAVMDAALELRRAAEDALSGAFDAITRRVTEEDLRDRIASAVDTLADKRAELAAAQRVVGQAPQMIGAANRQLRAAQQQVDAAEAAAKTDSPELAAARRRLQEAEDALSLAGVTGSDRGWFQEQVSAAKAELAELERAERDREQAALAAAKSELADAERNLADVERKVASAMADVESLPGEVESAEKALERANLRLFELLAREGLSPMGAGAAQSELRRIGEAAGLSHEEMVAVANAQVALRNADRRVAAAQAWFPERLTLVIEGQPFEAMLAEHDRQLLAQINAGVAP